MVGGVHCAHTSWYCFLWTNMNLLLFYLQNWLAVFCFFFSSVKLSAECVLVYRRKALSLSTLWTALRALSLCHTAAVLYTIVHAIQSLKLPDKLTVDGLVQTGEMIMNTLCILATQFAPPFGPNPFDSPTPLYAPPSLHAPSILLFAPPTSFACSYFSLCSSCITSKNLSISHGGGPPVYSLSSYQTKIWWTCTNKWPNEHVRMCIQCVFIVLLLLILLLPCNPPFWFSYSYLWSSYIIFPLVFSDSFLHRSHGNCQATATWVIHPLWEHVG